MSNFKGTKNWIVTNEGEDIDDVRIQIDHGAIDLWFGLEDWPSKKQAQANALLISKAPEMLEMLERLVMEFEIDNATEYQCNLMWEAKKLIKEATEL